MTTKLIHLRRTLLTLHHNYNLLDVNLSKNVSSIDIVNFKKNYRNETSRSITSKYFVAKLDLLNRIVIMFCFDFKKINSAFKRTVNKDLI